MAFLPLAPERSKNLTHRLDLSVSGGISSAHTLYRGRPHSRTTGKSRSALSLKWAVHVDPSLVQASGSARVQALNLQWAVRVDPSLIQVSGSVRAQARRSARVRRQISR